LDNGLFKVLKFLALLVNKTVLWETVKTAQCFIAAWTMEEVDTINMSSHVHGGLFGIKKA